MKYVHVVLIALAVFVAGCATASDKERKALIDQPVNCATADQDIEALTEALPSRAERGASLLRTLTPVGAATSIVTLQYRDRAKVAAGRTERAINNKIADIYEACATGADGVADDDAA